MGFIILCVILITISGFSEAVMDKLQFHYNRSVFIKLKNQQFWNPEISWKNKWFNGDPVYGERFKGSSTIFVGLTDAWHLFKSIRTFTLFLSLFLVAVVFDSLFFITIHFIILRIFYGLSFTYLFNTLDEK